MSAAETAAVPATHCQICARPIKVLRGRIAAHGYRQPHRFHGGAGSGWRTGSCFGARFRPFEVAADALPQAIERSLDAIVRLEARVEELLATPPEKVSEPAEYRRSSGPMDFERPADFDVALPSTRYGWRTYGWAFWALIGRLRDEVVHHRSAVRYLGERLGEWRAAHPEVPADCFDVAGPAAVVLA